MAEVMSDAGLPLLRHHARLRKLKIYHLTYLFYNYMSANESGRNFISRPFKSGFFLMKASVFTISSDRDIRALSRLIS